MTPAQASRLDTIDASARHLLSIINDILDISKIEAGKLELEQTGVDLPGILDNVVSILSERANEKGLKLRIEADRIPGNLSGDPTRLQQSLLNYATNAVKFTEAGEITLRVRLGNEAADSVLVRFEVADTGIGIPPGALGRLFRAFEQADTSTTREFGGTGLGLAITRHLAEIMGGESGAESTLGEGSTFWFSARLGKSELATANTAVKDVAAEAVLKQRFGGVRILLVDDEPINREVAQMLLEDTGLVVDTADDGTQAVVMAQATPYAAVLMDMQMPQMDGMEATRQLRRFSRYGFTPIIAMTANAFAEDKARGFDAGMNDFLIKPFSPDELFAILLRALDRNT